MRGTGLRLLGRGLGEEAGAVHRPGGRYDQAVAFCSAPVDAGGSIFMSYCSRSAAALSSSGNVRDVCWSRTVDLYLHPLFRRVLFSS